MIPTNEASQDDGLPHSETSNASHEEDVQSVSISSADRSISLSDSHDPANLNRSVEEHRDLVFASVLEDYYRTRAAEFLNTANPGKNYTRLSDEVQPLARQLFSEATRQLSSNGLLAASSASESTRDVRLQYLSGLDALAAGNPPPSANVLDPMHDLVQQTSQLALVPHPMNNLQLTVQPPPPKSHYRSSFTEVALLGKGGFGKVYSCFNPLDQKTYAVKKIPLSPKLGQLFSEGKHDGLQHILREVHVMAKLEHPNVVRYHATWFEQPHQMSQAINNQTSPPGIGFGSRPHRRQPLLLDSRPFTEDSFGGGATDQNDSFGDCGFVFGEDTPSDPEANGEIEPMRGPEWSEQATSDQSESESSSADGSDLFTDDKTRSKNIETRTVLDESCHVLYIQMSMYPTTLAQYISSSKQGTTSRHCFHLVPTLRLLLAIVTGLQYIHAKGLVHRDIKPGNIFLSSPETCFHGGYCDTTCPTCSREKGELLPSWVNPRIGDFGLVTELAHGEIPSSIDGTSSSDASEQGGSGSHKPVGTVYYRPPVIKSKNDEKIDVFSIGVVFVEMLFSCSTAMERVDLLQGLQRGYVPDSIGGCLKDEGYCEDLIEDVFHLAQGMVEPDPDHRWSLGHAKERIGLILHRCEMPAVHEESQDTI